MEYYAVNGFFTMCVAYGVWHLRLHYLLCVCMEIIAMCYVLYVIFRLHAKGMVRIRVRVRKGLLLGSGLGWWMEDIFTII